jgi:hypothetical protein
MLEVTPAAREAVELLLQKFESLLSANRAEPPDLHFVIVEPPKPGQTRIVQLPHLGAVRPDLQRKSLIHEDIIPTLPSIRILYLGDKRWLARFLQLARDAAVTFRSHDPGIEKLVTRATWEGEQFFMPNLWPVLVRDIIELSGRSKDFLRRWRWGEDAATQIVPYDEAELQAWVEATRVCGGLIKPPPPKDVNFTTFNFNAVECSCAALEWSAYQIRLGLEAATKVTTPPTGNVGTEAPADQQSKPQPLIVLRGSADGPIVRGKEKPRLTVARFNVIKALIDAGPGGLSEDELKSKSGHGGAVNTLKKLATSDDDWKSVIILPGKPGLRYRVRLTEPDGS